LKISLPTAARQGRRQRGGFYLFIFLKILCREPRAEAVDKDGFSIFLKKSCAEGPVQRPSAKTVFYFLKKFFAECFWQLRSAKLGTPELENFFPGLPSIVVKSTRQRLLCRRPLSSKRPHFFLSTLTNIYITCNNR
jgi:hypothetical protein